MRNRGKLAGLFTLALCLLSAPADVFAQADYPNRVIKIIVPFPPGTAVDVVTRTVADKLSRRWNQPIIIENRTGATGNIGTEVVWKADPDGYTLLSTPPPPLAINPTLYHNLKFDAAAFVPVSLLVEVPNVLVINADVPANTLQEFLALAKAKPGELTFGSTGSGGTPLLTMEMLKLKSGIKLRDIPYRRGVAPALLDLLGGRLAAMFVNITDAVQNVRAGKFKALAVTTAKRLPELPNVPAMAETYPGFYSSTWSVIMAPPKTPQAIADKLSAAIVDAFKMPDVQQTMKTNFMTVMATSTQNTGKFIKAETERWRDVIVRAGIKVE